MKIPLLSLGGYDRRGSARFPADNAISWRRDPSWSRFAGLYRSRGSDAEVVELNRRLVMIDPSGSSPETQMRLVPVENGLFRPDATSGSAAVEEVVRFVERNGKVLRM